jgi:hypothetical protein
LKSLLECLRPISKAYSSPSLPRLLSAAFPTLADALYPSTSLKPILWFFSWHSNLARNYTGSIQNISAGLGM